MAEGCSVSQKSQASLSANSCQVMCTGCTNDCMGSHACIHACICRLICMHICMCTARAPKAFIRELGLIQWHRDVTPWHTFPTIPGSLPPSLLGALGASSPVWGCRGSAAQPLAPAASHGAALSQHRWQMIHLLHQYDAHLHSLRLDVFFSVFFFNGKMINLLVLVLQKL